MIKPQCRWRIAHSEASLGWGGQEHRLLAELRGFRDRGGKVWLLAPGESTIFQRATAKEISCEPLRVDKWRFPSEVIRLASWLRRNQIQILNTHSSRDGWLVGMAGRLARVPLLIRSRHIDVDYPNRWISRHAFTTLADHVISTSDKITAHLQSSFGLPASRTSTVPTGVDLKRFCPTGPKALLPLPDDAAGRPLVGMVSVLRSWKGHTTFLQAAVRLKETGFAGRFVIVGDGPMRPHIEQQIAELNLGEAVALTGHQENVPEILRTLSLLTIPSTRHEGVPQIGLQALACKTPVIGSDVGGIPEIIREGQTGRTFPAQDVGALAARIQETLNQPETTARLADAGREMVEAEYSLDAMLDRLDAIYRRYLPG